METPVLPQKADSVGGSGAGSKCEQSFVTTVHAGDAFMDSQEDRVAWLGDGATANLACFCWLAQHNRILERRGVPRVATFPSKAKFRFRDGRLGEVRHAADIPVWIVGNKRKFTAFARGGDVPALYREGAMEAIGGQLDYLRGLLIFRRRGSDTP